MFPLQKGKFFVCETGKNHFEMFISRHIVLWSTKQKGFTHQSKFPHASFCISLFLILIILTMTIIKYKEWKKNKAFFKNAIKLYKKIQKSTGTLRYKNHNIGISYVPHLPLQHLIEISQLNKIKPCGR